MSTASLLVAIAALIGQPDTAAPSPLQSKADLHYAISGGSDAAYEDALAGTCVDFDGWAGCDPAASWDDNMAAWCATEAEQGDHVCEQMQRDEMGEPAYRAMIDGEAK